MDVRTGVRLEVFTIVWMLVEGVLSIGAGFLARSVLLIAFGIDSGIELITGGIVLWRLSVESHDGDLEHVELAERRAAWVTGIALALLCVYVFATAAFNLIVRGQPKSSVVGIAVALAALVVMPWLAVSKRRIGARIESASLRADAASSMTCAYMAGTVLVGLALNATFQLWWVESVAALIFLGWLIREAREALEEARGGGAEESPEFPPEAIGRDP